MSLVLSTSIGELSVVDSANVLVAVLAVVLLLASVAGSKPVTVLTGVGAAVGVGLSATGVGDGALSSGPTSVSAVVL